MKKIKVGIVNYLNTAPLVYGLQNSSLIHSIDLTSDYPANLARDLVSNNIDLGLVPVAVIPRLQQWWLVGSHCIGAEGSVASVCLFSEVPLASIRTILLDYQSRTSVELIKILVRDFWKLSNVKFENAQDGFESRIKGETAAVVIGDRALQRRRFSPYSFDLAEAWMSFTGLPFVFAAWVSNKPLDEEFVTAFDEANASGVKNIDKVIATLDQNSGTNLQEYFTKYISYQLDEKKRLGLQKFLHYLDPKITLSM